MTEESPSLLASFLTKRATLVTFIINILVSFGIGSTVGIVPEILSDRYARIYHDYDGPDCSTFQYDAMPKACEHGADDAQSASAMGTLFLNLLTLFFSPVVGSMSDVHGRRIPIIIGVFLCILSPVLLILLQLIPTMRPIWYYAANSSVGIVPYTSIMFAAISDVVPENIRAPSFAILLAGFYTGFALSPSFAPLLGRFSASLLSSFLVFVAFLVSLLFLPETLPNSLETSRSISSEEEIQESAEDSKIFSVIITAASRPFREATILHRNMIMRLLAMASFFASMVYSTDASLVIYYVENHLNIRDKDIANMFLVMGCVGIVMQAFLLQPFIKCMGEKGLLVACFLSGTIHNFLYGAAKGKAGIYVALCLSQFTKLNYPMLSSVASKGALESEQGQVQGALFATNALAAAIGPVLMQLVYDHTKDNSMGPGTMFILASCLYFTGMIAVSFIPLKDTRDDSISDEGLEEPLLEPELMTANEPN